MNVFVQFILVGFLGVAIGYWLCHRDKHDAVEAAKNAAWRDGYARGEKSARFHNRSFIRYENYFRATSDEVMPGPFVPEDSR